MEDWNLNRTSNVVMAMLAVVGSWLSNLLGGWDKAVNALTVFICIDVISGWIRAGIQKRLSSDESYKGLLKKGLIYLIVIVAAQADALTNSSMARNAVVIFYCAREALSVLENAAASGLPLPPILKDILEKLNEKKFVS